MVTGVVIGKTCAVSVALPMNINSTIPMELFRDSILPFVTVRDRCLVARRVCRDWLGAVHSSLCGSWCEKGDELELLRDTLAGVESLMMRGAAHDEPATDDPKLHWRSMTRTRFEMLAASTTVSCRESWACCLCHGE